jgi:anti-anti-sigma factor
MIDFVIENDQLTCSPLKELSAGNIPEMHDLIVQKLLQIKQWELLVLDCTNVTALSSISVNLMIGLFKKSKSMDKEFKISNCNESILKVLKLFKLDRQFSIE